MADNMIRNAGRGDDGTAKAIKTDNEGVLYANLHGKKLTKKHLYIVGDDYGEVEPGQTVIREIRPGEGYVGFLKTLFLSCPPIGTTGTHEFRVYVSAISFTVLRFSVAANLSLRYDPGRLNENATLISPIDVTTANRLMDGLTFDNDSPLIVSYTNDTDRVQDSTRIIRLLGHGEGV